jgi:predicted CXXCH cytochrome family protein
MIIAPAPAQAAPKATESTCVQCHLSMGDPFAVPVKLSAQDIHFQNGLSCHSCHGGDPTVGIEKGGPADSMNPRKGFVGKPGRKQIAALCASCHSQPDYMRKYNPQARVDQFSEYLTSVHGKKNQANDPNVATCTDCHGNHGIRAIKNPNSPVYATNVAETCGRCHSDAKRMGPYKIATDQAEKYGKSVHGTALMVNRDLAAPTCNSCHGNHGATPPGVDSVANVCGQCHAMQWDLFGKSPHKKAFAENKWPACVTCHQNHEIERTSDAMLGVEEPAVCSTCHEKASTGYNAALQMKSGITGLQGRLAAATQVLERAARAGMEVSGPTYQLTEGRDRMIRARVEIHQFDTVSLQKTLAEGDRIAAACEQSGWKALSDLAYRRKGMAVSAVILLCMIGLLLLKIRQLKT